jgi:hypothetical protein
VKPLLVEETLADDGIYVTEWYCEPPSPGVKFAVIRCEWNELHTVRRVQEIIIATEERHRRI